MSGLWLGSGDIGLSKGTPHCIVPGASCSVGSVRMSTAPRPQDRLVPYSPGTHILVGEKVDAKVNKVINFRSRQMLGEKNGDVSVSRGV